MAYTLTGVRGNDDDDSLKTAVEKKMKERDYV